jgi:hypothetical protein
MSDPQAAIDLTNYIPKADYEKAISEKDTTVSTLRDQISKIQAELLSPEYVEYKSKGKQQSQQQTQPTTQPNDQRFNELAEQLQLLKLNLEWRDTATKYPDLNDYKDKIDKYYQKTGNANATYEEVYKLVKLAEEESKTPPKKEAEAPKKPFATEKPGASVPFEAVEKKNPKTTEEANAMTVAQLREKYGSLGDTI